ncbi:hypothetical protein Plhal304r1_c024g0081711 [Plasmopara halstedii]
MEEYFLLLNVIKAQRIIDTPKILNLRRDQIDLIKENTFSFWKSRGMTPDDLSQILVHMDKPESDLVKWYESYLLKTNSRIERFDQEI